MISPIICMVAMVMDKNPLRLVAFELRNDKKQVKFRNSVPMKK
jgi:hypothetical protein